MADTANKPSRAEETRRERRMKPGEVVASGVKLGLDEAKLDRNKKVYRWVKDEGNRVQVLTAQDYDLVDEPVKPDSIGAGTIPTAHGGVGDSGKPYNMVLMAKERDWYEDDQKLKRKPLDEMDKSIRGGTAHLKSGDSDFNSASYTPEGGNSLTR